jgi:ABC-type dipeptide/oligopeptide/nickel transport system ATPase subunit
MAFRVSGITVRAARSHRLDPADGRIEGATLQPVLRAENVSKQYKRQGRTRINGKRNLAERFDGAIFSKHTIDVLCLACLESVSSGSIWFGDTNITMLGKKELCVMRPRIQLVFQDSASSLNPRFSAVELVSEPLRIQCQLSADERRGRSLELLERVGIPREKAAHRPDEFSGGQRQRIALAQALALKPQVLIWGEAISALDCSVLAQMVNLLLELQASLGLTDVFITHDLAMAAHIADEVAVMERGRIVEMGVAQSLVSALKQEVTRRLLPAIPHPGRSLEQARVLLKEAGFSWKSGAGGESRLVDRDRNAVEFSILTSSSNADRTKMAAIVQDDLKELGIRVQVVPLEFRSLIDRVTQVKDYDACVLGLASFAADPNSDLNVWLSSGGTHPWNPSQAKPATPWEAEIDELMAKQLAAPNFERRKKLYGRVQQILADYQPMIFLVSPNILTGAKNCIGNFHLAVLESYVLWNADQLYVRSEPTSAAR